MEGTRDDDQRSAKTHLDRPTHGGPSLRCIYTWVNVRTRLHVETYPGRTSSMAGLEIRRPHAILAVQKKGQRENT